MVKRDIVVVPNENIVLIPDGKYHKSSESEVHSQMFYEFCSKFNINVDFDRYDLGQICAYELAMIGHFSIMIESDFAILYVPSEVTNNQLEWVKENYSFLNSYDIHGIIYDEKYIKQIDKDEKMINPLKEIYNIMKKRNKIKKEGVSRCTMN